MRSAPKLEPRRLLRRLRRGSTNNDGLSTWLLLVAIQAMAITVTPASAGGRIVGWGRNNDGQCSIPMGISNVVEIAGGVSHSVALREDGSVVAWGASWPGVTNVPPDLTNAVALAAGLGHSLAIRKTGEIVSWGWDGYDQASVPLGLTNVVSIAGGAYHNLALRSDGTIVSWGTDGSFGQTNVPTGLGVATAISAGGRFNLALKRDGTVAAWGENYGGQTNVPVGLSNVVAIAAGDFHCLALKADGTVVAWGDNSGGQISIPPGLSNVVAVRAGGIHSIALRRDGSLVAWGSNGDSQATIPSGLTNVAAISVGEYHSLALSWDGPLIAWRVSSANPVIYSGKPATFRCTAVGFPIPAYQWKLHGTNIPGGTNSYLFVDESMSTDSSGYEVVVGNTAGEPLQLKIQANIINQPPVVISSPVSIQTNITGTATFSVRADGSPPLTYQWLFNGGIITDRTNSSLVVSNLNRSHTGDYSVLCANVFGIVESAPAALLVAPMVGWGRPGCSKSPAQVPPSLLEPAFIAAGHCRSMVITEVGNLVEWGDAYQAQPYIPVPNGTTDIVAVAEAQEHAIALKSDGTITIFGSTGYTNQPVGLKGVVAVAAGRYHNVALRKDGTVVAWNYVFPPLIPGDLTNVIAISACENQSIALRKDGTVASWGSVAQPSWVLAVTNAVAIAAGGAHCLVLRGDGTVLAWGGNGFGATNVPPALNNVVAISAGSHHSLALRADGTIVAWGSLSEPNVSSVPPGLTNAIAISGGYDYSLAMAGETALSFWKHPAASIDVIRSHTNVLFAGAIGLPPIYYQWQRDGTNIPGAIGSFLFLEDLDLTGDVRKYSVVASNSVGAVISPESIVRTVDVQPFIVSHPISTITNFGRTVRFSAEADGSWPLSYQWKMDGLPISGATDGTLVLTNVGFVQEGNYSVTVSNAFGSATSDEAVLTIGRVLAWGRNTAGETNPPPSFTNVVAISAGNYHGLALRDNGTVTSWGARTNIPAGLSNVIQIDAGGYNSVALRGDGSVRVWGDGGSGAYYTGFAASLSNVVSVAAGDFHYAALKLDGTVAVWATQGTVTNVPANVTNVISLAAAGNYCLALRGNGTIVAWGAGPTNIPAGLTDVTVIAGGSTTAAAMRGDGAVVAWNSSGVLSLPVAITNVASLAIGSSYGLGLRHDGTIIPWGTGFYGQTNLPRALSNFVAIATDPDFSIGLVSTDPVRLWHLSSSSSNVFSGQPIILRARAIGQLPLAYQWQLNGNNIAGATNADFMLLGPTAANSGSYQVVVRNGLGDVISETLPLDVVESAPLISQQPVSVETNVYATARFTISADGSRPLTYQWLSNGIPVPGAINPTITFSNLQVSHSGVFNVMLSNSFGVVQSAAAGISVRPVVAWGLGVPASTNVALGVTNVATVVAGAYHNVALKRDGTLLAWGTNSYGILQEPVPPSLSNVVSLSFGPAFGVAALSDGSIASWGAFSNASLMTNALSVSAGYGHVLALTSGGKVVAWGDNTFGQSDVPAGLHDVVEIAAGQTHSMARRKDGTVIVWGRNPDAIEFTRGLSNVVGISAFNDLKLAATSDGRVVAWGSNSYGEGTVPPTATNVIQIAAGDRLGVALRRDGTVVRWGTQYPTPTTVPAALRNVVAISTGGRVNGYSDSGVRILALVGQGPPFVRRIVSAGTTAFTGQKLVLSLEAVGQWPLSYQWRFNGSDIPGATNAHLWLPNIQLTNSGAYSVLVSNSLGGVIAEHSSINVLDREPDILVHPVGRSTNITGSADFEVVCNGSEPLYYQWFHDGNPIPGSNNSRLRLKGLNLRQAGDYSVIVSNAFGLAVSSNVSLSISPLVAWGCSDVCPPQVPTDGFDVVALAAGDGHGLALKSDGTVFAWGNNDEGQANVPIGLTNVIAISACEAQNLALRSDGTVVGWGWRTNIPPDLLDVVAISAGEWHDLAFKRNGEVVSWGFWNLPRRIVPSWATNALGGAGSRYHSAMFRRDGSVLAWDPDSGSSISVPSEFQNVVEMTSHLGGISARRSDGSIVTWGSGVSSSAVTETNTDFVSHAVGYAYSLGLARSGTIVVWQQHQPGEMPIGLQDIVAIASGGYQGLALAGVGRPQVRALPNGGSTAYSGQKLLLRVEAVGEFPLRYQWLLNGVPIVGATNATFFRTAASSPGNAIYSVDVSNALGATNVHVAGFSIVDSPPVIVAHPSTVGGNVFSNALFSVVADGSGPLAYQWHFDGEAIAGATNSTLALTNLWPTQTGVYQVLVSNRFGTLVSEPAELRVTPVVAWGIGEVPPGLSQLVDITVGANCIVGLNLDGTVVSWTGRSNVATNVPSDLTGMLAIAAGGFVRFGAGVRDDQKIVEWDIAQSHTNVAIVRTGAVAVAVGSSHRLALTTNGTVLAWGDGFDQGQTNVPIGLSSVIAIAAAGSQSMALRADGTVRAWGYSNYGLTNTTFLTDIVAVDVSGSHSLALKSNGTVVAWGFNDAKQTNVPSALNDVISVAAGGRHSLALKRDGTVVAWGDNQYGATNTPPFLTNVIAIAAGPNISLSLIENPLIHRSLQESVLRSGKFSGKIPSFSGRRFTLEATQSLSDTNWTSVGRVIGRGGISILSDTNILGGQKFYRLRRD
jgi:alpha-tubulin suppressor-like RCC1 family protein